MEYKSEIPRIIIVGGGAGGLELAAKLGRKFGKSKKASIILVDCSSTHIWKPLLHEIAAGTLNSYEDELNYLSYASQHYFQFCLGTLQSLNRTKKEIILAPILDDLKQEIIPERVLPYDILVIAVGSVANDFNINGVKEYCLFLDTRDQAEFLHRSLLNHLLNLSYQEMQLIPSSQAPAKPKSFKIAVVGGGATGIELIAELHHAVRVMANYGVGFDPKIISFSLVEAGNQLLPALPKRLSDLVLKQLERLEVNIFTGERVERAAKEGLYTQSGKFFPADMTIWSAGIKAPDFLKNLDGLETNRINQLLVKQTLQTTLDDSIFALGDCCSCSMSQNLYVPPRAQSAHQEAIFLVKSLTQYIKKKPLPNFN